MSFYGRGVPHTCTPVVCWNDSRHIRLTGSRAWLACSYFTKAKPCRPDFTCRNWSQVNTYCLLLSSFVHFLVQVKVNSLTYVIRNFCPYSSKFVSHHVFAAVSLQQKSNAEKKRESKHGIYEKEKTNRKWQDSWKWAASGEEHLWLSNDEAKSGIGSHHTSSYFIECTTFKLEGIKNHERSTLRELCIKIAQAKRAQAKLLTREFACATVEGEGDSSEQRISLLRRQGHTRTSNKFWWVGGGGMGGIWNQFITSVFVFIWYSFDFPLMEKKKSETELTAGVLKKKKNQKHTKG